MTKILVDSELLEALAKCLDSAIDYSQRDFDHPPEPSTEWDFNAGVLVTELRAALDAPQQEAVAVVPFFSSVLSYSPGEWFKAHSVDEMEAFYWSRLPAIRDAAKECGYAVAVHGSARRDFDLIAMPWREDAADRETLAHAVARAACGISRDGAYQWETKPAGRFAVSMPICWTSWHDMISAGHIDLSVIEAHPAPSVPEEQNVPDTELPGMWEYADFSGGGTDSVAPKPPTTDDRKDAERYQWLRSQHEGTTPMELDADGMPMPSEIRTDVFVVFKPGEDTSLEPVCSIPGELDAAIDAAMAAQKGDKE